MTNDRRRRRAAVPNRGCRHGPRAREAASANGATWTRTSVASSVAMAEAIARYPGVRQRALPAGCAAGRKRRARPGGRAGPRCSRRGISSCRRATARCALRIHRPGARRTARPRLPARRRLDAVQHRHPRPGDARVRGARRLLRDRRRLRAVARAQVSGRRSNRSSTSCDWLARRGPRARHRRRAGSRSAAIRPAPTSASRPA